MLIWREIMPHLRTKSYSKRKVISFGHANSWKEQSSFVLMRHRKTNQPRPQGFSLKKCFLREKPWGRGCSQWWQFFLTFFNPRTYTQSHIPTVVQGGGRGWWNPLPPLGFWYVAFRLLYKMRCILWVVALLEVCDVTKYGCHHGFFKNYNSGEKRKNY